MTPASRCRIPWCESAHSNGGAHYGEGPTVSGVSMLYLQSDVDHAPIIRLSYPTSERSRLDVTPQLARDMATMLTAVGLEWMAAFCDALRQAADTLGGAA
jgi:hypothetical protein